MKTTAVLLPLLVTLGLSAARAQQAPPPEQPAPATTPAPGAAPGATPLPLPLREAVAQALERNLDIAVRRLDPDALRQEIVENEAAFDLALDGTAEFSRSETEPQSAFAASSNKEWFLSTGLTKVSRRGGFYRLSWNYNDQDATYPGGVQQFRIVPHRAFSSLTFHAERDLLRNYSLSVEQASIERAKLRHRLSEEDLRTQILVTIESVEQGYWDVFGAYRALDVAHSSLDLAKDFLRQTRIRVDVGTLPPIEITTAEAEVASREEDVIVAENRIRNLEDQLRALVRMTPDSPDWNRPIRTTDAPGFAPQPIDTDKAIATALARRPDIVRARVAVEQTQLEERFSAGQTLPQLRVYGSYTRSGNNYDLNDTVPISYPCLDVDGNPTTCTELAIRDQGRTEPLSELVRSPRNNDWVVGARFSYPLGNRAAKAAVARTRLRTQQAQLTQDQLEQSIRVEVRTAVRDLQTAARRVETTRVNVTLQRKKLDAEQKRYENGLSTAYQVLQFQTDLRNAELAEIQAIVDYNKALATLGRAQGTLGDDRGIQM